jgi:hypothetical protein
MARKVIRKFCEDRANGTLGVPLWKSAPHWVLLYESNCRFKSFIKSKHYLTYKRLIVTGRSNNGMLTKFPLKFAMIALQVKKKNLISNKFFPFSETIKNTSH